MTQPTERWGWTSLGQMLLNDGVLNQEQLAQALGRQRKTKDRHESEASDRAGWPLDLPRRAHEGEVAPHISSQVRLFLSSTRVEPGDLCRR